MTTRPQGARIAVIIPCYEDGELAAGAVASVREREPVEIVVVDDGSRDAPTLAALERLEAQGVRVIRHDGNRGLAQARTTGLHATSAAFVFPLDADDEAVPGRLGAMATRLEDDPHTDLCFGDYFEFGKLELVRAVPSELDPCRLAFTNEYPVCALFRRTLLEAVDRWRPIDAYEDWHLWMTLAERGTRAIHLGPGRITYRRRQHGSRMLTAARGIHPELYARLRREHSELSTIFRRIAAARRCACTASCCIDRLRRPDAVRLGGQGQDPARRRGRLDAATSTGGAARAPRAVTGPAVARLQAARAAATPARPTRSRRP